MASSSSKDRKIAFSRISQTDICLEELPETTWTTTNASNDVPPVETISGHKPFSKFISNTAAHCEQKQPLLERDTPEKRNHHKKLKSAAEEESTSESECSTHLLETPDICPTTKNDEEEQESQKHSPTVHSVKPSKCPTCPTDLLLAWNWPAIRLICLVAFLSSMSLLACVVVAMLLASSGHCGPPRQWWQGTVMYEVFPASFQDTDGDGFGDLRGLVWRLDYVRSLNVSVLRLNSIFSALDYPLEYEHIIDFSNVDPHLGRMEDFDHFLSEVRSRGMKLVLDINPTVTSDQHTWAAHWLLNRPGQYENYYVNVTDVSEEPPYDPEDTAEEMDRLVPHRTFGSQLYLNWSNLAVQQEFFEVLELWLNKGVDGFYVKHLERIHVHSDEELLFILEQWRWTLDRYGNGSNKHILMTSESFIRTMEKRSPSLVSSFLSIFDLLDVRLNVKVNGTLEVAEQVSNIASWTSSSTSSRLPWITWHIGGVETSRLATRLHRKYTLGSIFLLMMLPGSVSIFYGDEIGLEDSFDIFSQKVFRGGQLCPMQWSAASQANFTDVDALPWLPVHPAYSVFNAANQAEITKLASRIISLRQSAPSIAGSGSKGGYRFHQADGSVVGLERYYPRSERYYLAANLGYVTETRDMSKDLYEAKVLVSTHRLSGRMQFHNVRLEPGEAFVALIDS